MLPEQVTYAQTAPGGSRREAGQKPGGERGEARQVEAQVPKQQECGSKLGTEVEREWEKNEVAMKEEARQM
jgi:hypothetical protein